MFPLGFRDSISIDRPLADQQLGNGLRIISAELTRATAENVRIDGPKAHFSGGTTRIRSTPLEPAIIFVSRGTIELVPGSRATLRYRCSTRDLAIMTIGAPLFAAGALQLIQGGLTDDSLLFIFGLSLASLCLCWLIASAAFKGLAIRLLNLAVHQGAGTRARVSTPLT